jgi:hypothetical protein
MKALRIVLIVFLALILIPTVLRLVGISIALVKDLGNGATNASYLLGSFIGTLLVCAVFVWLIKYLWSKNKTEGTPPPPPLP